MKFYFICGSVTYALKGRKLLATEGIGSVVRRIPENMGSKGCGYIIEVSDQYARFAYGVLTRNGVSLKGIYTDGARGFEEVAANDLP